MDKQSIYIETSIISYLAARPSKDIWAAAAQAKTNQFWKNHKDEYELFTSEIVSLECLQGDNAVAKRRLELLEGIPSLSLNEDARKLASMLLADKFYPSMRNTTAFISP
ncbi:MAG: hypothetical protein NUW37_10480 [Planctomycetes bacterium]|nr:hypothetical protein [Planctomycetota bacterium]